VLSVLRNACDVLPTLTHVRWMNGGKEGEGGGGGGENENVSRLYFKGLHQSGGHYPIIASTNDQTIKTLWHIIYTSLQ
jgi:hypothetical protein